MLESRTMTEKKQDFCWNKYEECETKKDELKIRIKELEAELDYYNALSALYLEEYDKEIMKRHD